VSADALTNDPRPIIPASRSQTPRGMRSGLARQALRLSLWAGIGLGLVDRHCLVHLSRAAIARPASGGRGGVNAPAAGRRCTAITGGHCHQAAALGTVTPLATVNRQGHRSAGSCSRFAFRKDSSCTGGDFLAQKTLPFTAAPSRCREICGRDQALLAMPGSTAALPGHPGAGPDSRSTARYPEGLVQQYRAPFHDEAQVKSARLNLQYTHIVAPASGQVGLRQVDQGNYVTR